jgi:hypothetical protein
MEHVAGYVRPHGHLFWWQWRHMAEPATVFRRNFVKVLLCGLWQEPHSTLRL